MGGESDISSDEILWLCDHTHSQGDCDKVNYIQGQQPSRN